MCKFTHTLTLTSPMGPYFDVRHAFSHLLHAELKTLSSSPSSPSRGSRGNSASTSTTVSPPTIPPRIPRSNLKCITLTFTSNPGHFSLPRSVLSSARLPPPSERRHFIFKLLVPSSFLSPCCRLFSPPADISSLSSLYITDFRPRLHKDEFL